MKTKTGQKHQKMLGLRSNWFMQKLKFTREEATEWANLEFMAFYGTEQSLVHTSDPGNTIAKLISRGLDPVLILEAKKDTKVCVHIKFCFVHIQRISTMF